MLSRNFRLQRVGDLAWLQKNYVFSRIAFAIDELIILNVGRGDKDHDLFCRHVKELSRGCFIPIAAGGGIVHADQAKALLQSGADKVVLNTALHENQKLVGDLAQTFGTQCLVASVDAKMDSSAGSLWTRSGSVKCKCSAQEFLSRINELPIGELYLNSMERDGTGQGYDFALLDLLPGDCSLPVIMAGGAGNWRHLKAGLLDERVDAVATAHLFNFVGDGFLNARKHLLAAGIELAMWKELGE